MSKRHRRRASEIANLKAKKPWFSITMILIGLIVIFFMRATLGDETAGLFTELVGDPDLQLPKSVSDGKPSERRDVDTLKQILKSNTAPPTVDATDMGRGRNPREN